MTTYKPYILAVVVLLLIASIYVLNSNNVERGRSSEFASIVPRVSSGQYELAKEITTPDGFINTDSKPLTIDEFIGKKVVLIDFWTYSCINCQRTTPYLNTWYEKYKDKGLVIIGIHTPEFEFEKKYENVKSAVEKFGIRFPVVLDNDYSTWTAYKNRYWPRKYLINIDGYVYDHIGEGAYKETEQQIQKALSERLAVLGEGGTITEDQTKESSTGNGARSPETYFGSAREPRQKDFLLPIESWDISHEFAQNTNANARILYPYTAKDVFFVAESDAEIVVDVFIDGKPVGSDAGEDIIKTSDGKSILNIKLFRANNHKPTNSNCEFRNRGSKHLPLLLGSRSKFCIGAAGGS
jgi:thiol-disulfide isomerase/thioredoxin